MATAGLDAVCPELQRRALALPFLRAEIQREAGQGLGKGRCLEEHSRVVGRREASDGKGGGAGVLARSVIPARGSCNRGSVVCGLRCTARPCLKKRETGWGGGGLGVGGGKAGGRSGGQRGGTFHSNNPKVTGWS